MTTSLRKQHHPLFFSLKIPVCKAKQKHSSIICYSLLVFFFFLLCIQRLFALSFFVFYSLSIFSVVFLLSYSEQEAFNQAILMISTIQLSGVSETVYLSFLFQYPHFSWCLWVSLFCIIFFTACFYVFLRFLFNK